MTRHDQRPANLARKGLRKKFGQRTDLPVRRRITDATRREIPRRSAGSARGYQERFASLVAWQSRLRPTGGGSAVSLPIAELGLNVRYCRRQGLGRDRYGTGSRAHGFRGNALCSVSQAASVETPSSAQGARPAGISAKLVKDPGGLHSLLGTCHLVMLHGQVALYEELHVVRIKDRLLDVLAGKALNRGPGLPEAQRDEFDQLGPEID